MSPEDKTVAAPEDLPFTAVEGPVDEATVFRCPLCGGRFTHGLQACPSCPIHAGCTLVTCPHCEYSFPRTSRLAEWIRRLFGRASSPAGE
jgi:hypothetical protein